MVRGSRSPSLYLISFALTWESFHFMKGFSVFNVLVALLKEGQGNDDSKKASCLESFEMAEVDAGTRGSQECRFGLQRPVGSDSCSGCGRAQVDRGAGQQHVEGDRGQKGAALANNRAAAELLKIAIHGLNKSNCSTFAQAGPPPALPPIPRFILRFIGKEASGFHGTSPLNIMMYDIGIRKTCTPTSCCTTMFQGLGERTTKDPAAISRLHGTCGKTTKPQNA